MVHTDRVMKAHGPRQDTGQSHREDHDLEVDHRGKDPVHDRIEKDQDPVRAIVEHHTMVMNEEAVHEDMAVDILRIIAGDIVKADIIVIIRVLQCRRDVVTWVIVRILRRDGVWAFLVSVFILKRGI